MISHGSGLHRLDASSFKIHRSHVTGIGRSNQIICSSVHADAITDYYSSGTPVIQMPFSRNAGHQL